jgi:predicted nuclease of predicted toxin-antitoxin system
MRFAIDACVPEQLADALRSAGADVVSAAGRPAMPDNEVLGGAVARDRVLITSDKDFGDLVFRDGEAAIGIVLIRFDPTSHAAVSDTAQRIVALPNAGRGAFTVLERNAERSRPMPDRD